MNQNNSPWQQAKSQKDSAVKRLILREGMKGYGVYCYLIETLFDQPRLRASMSELGALAASMRTKAVVLRRIILDYDLFVVKNGMYYAKYTAGNTSVNVEQRTSITSVNTDQPSQSRSANTDKAPKKTFVNVDKVPSDSPDKTPYNPTSSPHNYQKMSDKRPPKPLSSHAGARISVVDTIIISDNNNNNNKRKRAMSAEGKRAMSPEEREAACMALVDSLQTDRQWLEYLCDISNLPKWCLDYLPAILPIFKTHIRLYGKADELTDLKSVRCYFANYISEECRTGKRIREQLNGWNLYPETAPASAPVRSYEQIIDGKRTYLGMPIPDDAPPRPSSRAGWHRDLRKWIQ